MLLYLGGGDNNECFDVMTETKQYGDEISWSIGSCINNQAYTSNKVFTQECCLAGGDYKITCTESYGDGWNDGYLEIKGQQYCNDFTGGKEKQVDLSIGSSTGKV